MALDFLDVRRREDADRAAQLAQPPAVCLLVVNVDHVARLDAQLVVHVGRVAVQRPALADRGRDGGRYRHLRVRRRCVPVAVDRVDDAVRRHLAVAVLAVELVKVAVRLPGVAVARSPTVLVHLDLDVFVLDPVGQLQDALHQALLVLVYLLESEKET